ncbi:MAG TPA: SRPBCC domain-containing protein [Chitinophagaceae bacterium]|nr:SRPBCC domain-containing protein [Chitinophagaceae bacterium]
MKNNTYATANYTVAIEVAKPPAIVFNHIINDVSKYWPEEFEGESARLNDEFIFSSGDSHYSKNKVIELEPNKKVVWLVTDSIRKPDGFKWTGTRMIFTLTPKDGGTLLEFTYDGPVLEDEYDRLIQVCDMVIKERLYNFITKSK